MITHNKAYESAKILSDYCNERSCEICIFHDVRGECFGKQIIQGGMGNTEYPMAISLARENMDYFKKKGV